MPPAGPLLVDQLRFMAAQHADAIAYEDLGREATITFAAWDRGSNQVARWLIAAGVGKGDRVALYLESDRCLEWITAYAGIHKAGAVMVPVNTRLSAVEVTTILRHAEPAAAISGTSLLEPLAAVRRAVSMPRALIVGDGVTEADGIESWDA